MTDQQSPTPPVRVIPCEVAAGDVVMGDPPLGEVITALNWMIVAMTNEGDAQTLAAAGRYLRLLAAAPPAAPSDEVARLREALQDILKQLDVADAYASQEKPKHDALPSVWQLQNGHLREYARAALGRQP